MEQRPILPVAGLQQTAEDAVKAKTLSRPIADALIERVKVYPSDRVEVVWKVAMKGT